MSCEALNSFLTNWKEQNQILLHTRQIYTLIKINLA